MKKEKKEVEEVEEETNEEYKPYVQKKITINAHEGSTVRIYFIQRGNPTVPPKPPGGNP